MPSTYAHYRMGQQIVNRVPKWKKNLIEKNKELFDIGLHGPDILFYYKPLKSNPVNRIGYGMHEHAGREFFEYAAEVIRKKDHDTRYLAYVYGFICHFALDTTCHGYIDEKIAESGVSHTEIEVEFDRSLMLEDGYDPIRHKLTGHIAPSEENAKVISAFFKGTDPTEVKDALKGMIQYNNLLIAPSRLKRELIYALLRISGNYKEMHGLLVNFHANPDCEDSTRKLHQLYDVALERAVDLIDEYDKYLVGEQRLNPLYRYTFGGKEAENEERVYEIQDDESGKKLGAV